MFLWYCSGIGRRTLFSVNVGTQQPSVFVLFMFGIGTHVITVRIAVARSIHNRDATIDGQSRFAAQWQQEFRSNAQEFLTFCSHATGGSTAIRHKVIAFDRSASYNCWDAFVGYVMPGSESNTDSSLLHCYVESKWIAQWMLKIKVLRVINAWNAFSEWWLVAWFYIMIFLHSISSVY